GTDVFLGAIQHTNPLAAGASYSASGSFTVPHTLTAGNYYFLVATGAPVDEDAIRVYDANATNNTTATSTTAPVAPAPLAELSVSNVAVQNIAPGGGQMTVSWTVTNTGAATGGVSITDSVYLSFDQVFDPSTDRYLGSATHAGLAGGTGYTQTATVPLRS